MYSTATCQKPKTCVYCGVTSGSTVAHLYSDGYCVYCGKAKNDPYHGWSKSNYEKLVDLIGEAYSCSMLTRVSAETALSYSSSSVSGPYTATYAVQEAKEVKNKLYDALVLARANPEIPLDGQYANVEDALQAMYSRMSTASNKSVTSANWTSVATSVKSAAKTTESESSDLFELLRAPLM